MKSAIDSLRELNEASRNYPSVLPLIGAILELDAEVEKLGLSKQDKPEITTVDPGELTRSSLQKMFYRVLSTVGDDVEVARKIYTLLKSLE